MPLLLGVDTGGTYTDAVILDDVTDIVLAKAKSLTTRPDLAIGVGKAIDAAIAGAEVDATAIGMVSLSTTLATNALVEGQGGRVALIFIGFDPADVMRSGLQEALAGDPLIAVAGGHSHAGGEIVPLDLNALTAGLATLDESITGFAIAASFATRNPAHEIAARDLIRTRTGKPVTCSHELSSALGGPKRALTAVLNARLIGMIDGLIAAVESHLQSLRIDARLMVVRGDGALVSSDIAREKPIETILSGPAASIAGAAWLTGIADALISDIGGTTTDVCLLRDGRPKIDPQGARVGPYRTMVEAVAMRTTGLGGDSEVHVKEGLKGRLFLGPRRLMPVSLAATIQPDLVHKALDAAVSTGVPAVDGGRFVFPVWQGDPPIGGDKREQAVIDRLAQGPLRMGHAVTTRIEGPALQRIVARGHAMIAGVTPSDAAHVLGLSDAWDGDAATKALTLFAYQRSGAGERLAKNPEEMAAAVIAQLRKQTVDCLLETAFGEDTRDWGDNSAAQLTQHALTNAGLDRHDGLIRTELRLGLPVIGLGASAAAYYGPVGDRLGTDMELPSHADVANAIGAVVGQVAIQAKGSVTSPGAGRFVAHLLNGPAQFATQDAALSALEDALTQDAVAQAQSAGVPTPNVIIARDVQQAEIEGQPMFISADLTVTAQGRPRIAHDS
ncbi:N-methylhydantoinase A/oxoprolinase/acetone carboxylase, beta subunit [Cognatiyoonia koreensis]|uniref:N-methylhydantoinase A/oxoprolinase/acetone carboxylase, beta subunit n=1 Tax=Cognatiyoonia koreensis TaxID=364200 RepID=A0A1I0RKM6_9RHOB|nr:hydantoinase/oxoprolinase family protein [Cognatiyoonia koreensis]SEW41647.1 N-methylhydantoinase A/oxoprolinase/acetone carboxylase, beta subunit [Cognatiyoonia koreensis]